MPWTPLTSLFAGSVESLREAAYSGDVSAQFRLGRMCETGSRTPRNDAEAAMWYRRAADRGHAEAQFRLGLMYASGRGLAKDPAKAARWLRAAAEQGVGAAKRHLRRLTKEARRAASAPPEELKQSEQPEQPVKEAESPSLSPKQAKTSGKGRPPSRRVLVVFILIVGLIQIGMWVAQFQRFKTYNQRQRETTRTERPGLSGTARHFLRLAGKGDVEAIFRVARMYDRGSDGMPQDDKQAVAWYRKGAALGHARSEHCLGWMYEHGRGVPKNESEAMKWYRRAAWQGEEASSNRLRDLENRRREREELLAGQGDAEAQYRRGLRFELGKDSPKDDEQAALWYLRAAEQGHAQAQFHMGRFHDAGRGGLSQDDAMAARWYLRAAEQGLVDAQIALGWKYEKGLGVAQDDEQALEWYRKAAASGSKPGRFRLEELEKSRAGAGHETR